MKIRSNTIILILLISMGCSHLEKKQNRLLSSGESTMSLRISARNFPSIFQAWNPAERINNMISMTTTPLSNDTIKSIAKHDLIWHGIEFFGLRSPEGIFPGEIKEFTPESTQKALLMRAALLKENPNLIILAEIRYYTGDKGYLPEDSLWWRRKQSGENLPDPSNGENPTNFYLLDFHRADLQDQAASLCKLVINSGAVDGCFLDWWNNKKSEIQDRATLVKKMRKAIGEDGLIVVNVNNRIPSTGIESEINGLYLEGFNSDFFQINDWKKIVNIMQFEQTGHLKSPSFTALEGWHRENTIEGRNDYPLMRMTTAISLIFSDGYALFSDPNPMPAPDHLHDIYTPFWVDQNGIRPLGKPVEKPKNLNDFLADNSFKRNFENGVVVFNPPDANSSITATFSTLYKSLATNQQSMSFTLKPGDGDIFIK